jgi:signal transduction histidine kinase
VKPAGGGAAGLRAWGGGGTASLAFPVAALVAAVLVFGTTSMRPGVVIGLLAALVPWTLLAGGVRIGTWTMVVVGIGVPALVVALGDAVGAVFLALLAVAWIAARGDSRIAEVVAVVATVAVPLADAGQRPGENGNVWVFWASGSLFAWFTGRLLRRERQLVNDLTQARDMLHEAAGASERQRIAREVHDVVGHSLTVVLLNVVGARRVLITDPAAAAAALDRAEKVGRASVENVRAVVGLLRDPSEDGHEPPMPTAADISSLVHTAIDAGLPIDVEVDGDLDAIDAYAGLAAFRLVQEAISNVEHHAPQSDVVIRLVARADHLSVSVRNGPARRAPIPSSGGGTGLLGMRERLAALGGTMSAGPDSQGWLVKATIPLHRLDAGPP